MDRVFSAARIDLTKDVTGKWHGPGPRYNVARWMNGLKLTIYEIEAVIRPIAERRGPPSSLSYFNKPMAECAGMKARPPLQAAASADTPRRAPQVSEEERLLAYFNRVKASYGT